MRVLVEFHAIPRQVGAVRNEFNHARPSPANLTASAIIAFSLLASPTFAQQSKPEPKTVVANAVDPETAAARTFVSLQLENDFFTRSGDRYYTHGTQLSMLKVAQPPQWLDAITAWFPVYQKSDQLNLVNYTLGQKIFTPNDTRAKAIVPDDRPYAGYLYFSAAVLSQLDSEDAIDSANMIEISLGVVGPSAMGEQVQTGYHDLIGIDTPQGWNNQLHDEAALGFSYTRIWRRVQPVSGDLEIGVAPQISVALGNVYTYGAGGIMFRLGKNLKRDLSPPNIRPGFPGLAYFQGGAEPSWYAFVGFEGRYMARDIFLDGNTFGNSARVEKIPLVGDMQFGFVYQFDRFRMAISSMIRTREFETQQRYSNYGAVNFSRQY